MAHTAINSLGGHVIRIVATLMVAIVASCSAAPSPTPAAATPSREVLEIDAVAQRYAGYTLDRAAGEGYKRDAFCLDAASLGRATAEGAMGFHATNQSLLRGPIDPQRPQALLFDASGRVLGVEYEVMTEAVTDVPRLFGRTFSKLPAHAGVDHEHYALHVWFIENPNGVFADFNPRVGCPPGSTQIGGPDRTLPPSEHGEGH